MKPTHGYKEDQESVASGDIDRPLPQPGSGDGG
jgi:hypothetical protein